MRHFKL
jgi:quercetin dioxygenase-like cupin family protein